MSNYDFLLAQFIDNVDPGICDSDLAENAYVGSQDNLYYQFGGACWWWSAVAFNSLMDFDEQASGSQWTYSDGSWSPPSGTPWSGGVSAGDSITGLLALTYDLICNIAEGPGSPAGRRTRPRILPTTDSARSATRVTQARPGPMFPLMSAGSLRMRTRRSGRTSSRTTTSTTRLTGESRGRMPIN